jgi:hypothetical protein
MPILGVIDSGKSGHLVVPNSYYSIATINATGSSASITFSSIPSTYTHLQLRIISCETYTANPGYDFGAMSFNGDNTSGNYYSHFLYGDTSVHAGSLAGGSWGNGGAGIMSGRSYSGQGNNYAANIMDILDYSNTNKYKTTRTISGLNNNYSNANQGIWLTSTLWQSTSAINSITITTGTSNFTSNSQFALYGVK